MRGRSDISSNADESGIGVISMRPGDHESSPVPELRGEQRLLLQCAAPPRDELTGTGHRTVDAEYPRIGTLAQRQVAPRGLAELRRSTGDVQHVVDDLES